MFTLAENVEVIVRISNHEIMHIGTLIELPCSRPPKRKVYMFKKADTAGLSNDPKEFSNSYTHNFVEQFKDSLKTTINLFFTRCHPQG